MRRAVIYGSPHMRLHRLQREQRLAGAPAEVFAFFADAFNLQLLTSPPLRFEVVTSMRDTVR